MRILFLLGSLMAMDRDTSNTRTFYGMEENISSSIWDRVKKPFSFPKPKILGSVGRILKNSIGFLTASLLMTTKAQNSRNILQDFMAADGYQFDQVIHNYLCHLNCSTSSCPEQEYRVDRDYFPSGCD